jgi:aarF domain-containing kinase
MAGTSKPIIEGASPFLTPQNIGKVVDTLTQMRGAALKLGQIISIQGPSSKVGTHQQLLIFNP